MASMLATYPTYEPPFNRTLMWVAAGHGALILLLLLALWWSPTRPRPVKFINMVPMGDLVGGTPDAPRATAQPVAAVVPTPPASPTPPAPKAAPAAVVTSAEPMAAPPEPTPAPQPPKSAPPKLVVKPSPQPEAKAKPKPEPEKQPKVAIKKEKPAPAKPKKKKIEVTLKEVTRPAPSKSKPVKVAVRTTPRPEEVMAKLDAVIQKAGSLAAPNLAARSGSQDGSDNNFSDYYRLIRDQMFGAWSHPRHLLGRGLSTIVQIELTPSGKIMEVRLIRSSGNDEHDASALAAVRAVPQIRRPLPEGMDSRVEINFRLQR